MFSHSLFHSSVTEAGIKMFKELVFAGETQREKTKKKGEMRSAGSKNLAK